MPRPVLPTKVLDHIPDNAQQELIEHGPFESYTIVSYSGLNGGVLGSGSFVEVDHLPGNFRDR